MRNVAVLAAVAAVLAAQPAFAEKTGFYVGADVGQMSADIEKSAIDDLLLGALADEGIFVDGSSKLDDSDTTFAVTAGYRFLPYLAVEAQYLDLGEASYEASGDFYMDDFFVGEGNVDASIDSSGFGLSVLGILPIEAWELYARVGMYFGDTELKVGATIEGVSDSASDSKSEEELFYGIGAGYTFNDTWNVRLEYSVFQDIGDEELTGEADVDRLVLGLNYRF
jgi:OOP family OmpA-OmpF porin